MDLPSYDAFRNEMNFCGRVQNTYHCLIPQRIPGTNVIQYHRRRVQLIQIVKGFSGLYFSDEFQDRYGDDFLVFTDLRPDCLGHVSIYRNDWIMNRPKRVHVTLDKIDVNATQQAYQQMSRPFGPPVVRKACRTFYQLTGNLLQR